MGRSGTRGVGVGAGVTVGMAGNVAGEVAVANAAKVNTSVGVRSAGAGGVLG